MRNRKAKYKPYAFTIVAKNEHEHKVISDAMKRVYHMRMGAEIAAPFEKRVYRKRGQGSDGMNRTYDEKSEDEEAETLCITLKEPIEYYDMMLSLSGSHAETIKLFRERVDAMPKRTQKTAEISDEEIRTMLIKVSQKYGKRFIDTHGHKILEGAARVSETSRDPVIRGRIRRNVNKLLKGKTS